MPSALARQRFGLVDSDLAVGPSRAGSQSSATRDSGDPPGQVVLPDSGSGQSSVTGADLPASF